MAPRDPTTLEIKIRVRGALRPKLEEAARRHGIPLNAEVTRRLEESFEIDALKRELEIERQRVRDYIKEFSAREAGYHDRINKLTDYLLQITRPNVRVPQAKEDAA